MVQEGPRDKNNAVGYLSSDRSVHAFNTQIIGTPVRTGLCIGVPGIGTQSRGGNGGQTDKE
jgi:hypothetical protein